jgi:anti-sigma factor (TIGR02949 family)
MGDHVRDIDCRTALRQLWDYLDGELTTQRMAEVREHMAKCAHCLPHMEFGQRLLTALGSQREGGRVSEQLRLRVRAGLSAAGFTPG